MKIKNKALRVISYILLSIILVLFLVFILTYDFMKSKEVDAVDSDKLQDEFSTLVEEAVTKSINTRTVSLTINKEMINELIVYGLNNRDFDNNASIYWDINDVSIDIINKEIIFDIHADYKYFFNYKMRIRAFFLLEENKDSYTLKLLRLKIGSISIPSFLLRFVLGNSEDMSLASMLRDSTAWLPEGSINYKDFSLTIKKSTIVSNINGGTIGLILFEDNTVYQNLYSSYADTIFDNDLIDVKIDDGLILNVYYGKIINSLAAVNSSVKEEYLNTNDTVLFNSHYQSVLSKLLDNNSIVITKESINRILNRKIKAIHEAPIVIETKIHGASINHYLNYIAIDVVLEIEGQHSIIKYTFEKTKDTYLLKKIEIGKDDNEVEGSFIVVGALSDKVNYFAFLSNIGIGVNIGDLSLDMSSIFDGLSLIPYDSYIFTDDAITLISSKDYRNIIFQALKDENFDFSGVGRLNFDFSSDEKIKESVFNLNLSGKENLLKNLRDYFKESNLEVYNYIDNLIIKEKNND